MDFAWGKERQGQKCSMWSIPRDRTKYGRSFDEGWASEEMGRLDGSLQSTGVGGCRVEWYVTRLIFRP